MTLPTTPLSESLMESPQAGAVQLHATADALEAALDEILDAPRETGTVEMVVRRPAVDQREVLDEGHLDVVEGLVGDNWRTRGSSKTADGAAHPEMQINIMSARVIAAVAGDRSRWPLAGDQLFVDLDLRPENLPTGTRLAVGTATLEVTAIPHLGCKKFVTRFGLESMKFINSGRGKRLRLRGLNARVVVPGIVRPGDRIRKLAP
ncbi:MAG: MOSC domain-containing protein [Acidobacteriota bacterium]